jgi:drug/metabolite transporter (DMT)-like permease
MFPSGDQDRSVPWAGLFHLFVVYVVWGSTYLAIRVAVRTGSGFPPFLLGASRTLAAAVLLLAWNLLRGQRVLPTRREWTTLIPAGLLLWVGGNGLVNWAEQRADSGYAALLVGAMPIWVVLMESLIDRRRPTFRLIGALIVGFAGLGVLSWPVLRTVTGAGPAQAAALVLAPLSWGAGSIYLARRVAQLGPTASSAWQQLAGACGFLVVAICTREPWPHPSAQAWGAWGYLVAAGSIVAFTSFLTALRLLPTTLVTTYTYVNPVIAVFLGWLVLGERITAWTAAGTVLILVGVAGAFRERRLQPAQARSAAGSSGVVRIR